MNNSALQAENMPQLIFLGPPGSGKGTQASLLKKRLNYHHLSTGDLLRHEISTKTPLGLKVQSIMATGNLVSDEIVIELLQTHCKLSDGKYIFDGFPRTVVQAQMLQKDVLTGANSLAIEFKIQMDILLDRIVNRRTCPKCSSIYNIKYRPSRDGNYCENQSCAGAELIHREDDKENVVVKRIEVYQENIRPVIEFYSKLGNLRQVDGMLDGEIVFESVKKMFV